MKYLLPAITLLFATTLVFSQPGTQSKRDSMLNVLAKATHDSVRFNVLMRLGDRYERRIPDSAIYFYKSAETLAKKNNDTVWLLRFIAGYTDVLDIQNKYKEALALNLQSIALAKKINNPLRLAAAYNNLAKDYYYTNDYQTSADYFLKAASVLEQQNDKSLLKDLAGLYANVSGILSEINQFDKSYATGLKAIAMSRELKDDNTLSRSLENTGSVLLRLKKIDSSLLLYRQAGEIGERINDQYTIEIANLDMADAYLGLGEYSKLKLHADAALAAAIKLDDKDGISKAYGYLSEYYFDERNYALAKNYVQQAIQVMKANDIANHIFEQYQLLAEIELSTGNMASFRQYKSLSDSLREATLNAEMLKNTQDLEAKYSLNKKQWEIDNLTRQQKDQQVILKQRNIINWALAGAVLIFIVAAFLYYRNTQHKNKLLTAQDTLKQQRINELEKERQLLATESVLQGQEEERKRLAKDLHDGLGGILSSVKYSFTNMKKNLIVTEESAEAFDRSMVMLDKSITELRRVAHNMMPEALVNFGLDSALKDFCQGVNQSGAVALTYQSFELSDDDVPKNKASVVYRIVQELVNNVLKHAEAKTLLVQLVKKGASLSITVEDDGKGFDKNRLNTSAGIGFINLQNRVTYLGGTIDVQTAPGKGTSTNIEIPDIVTS